MFKNVTLPLALGALLLATGPALANQRAYHVSSGLYNGSYAKALWVSTMVPGYEGSGTWADMYMQGSGGIYNLPITVGIRRFDNGINRLFYQYHDSNLVYQDVLTSVSTSALNSAGSDMNMSIENTSPSSSSNANWKVIWNSYSNQVTRGSFTTTNPFINKGYVNTTSYDCYGSTTNGNWHKWWGALFMNTSSSWAYWTTSNSYTSPSSCTVTPQVSGGVGGGSTGWTVVK